MFALTCTLLKAGLWLPLVTLCCDGMLDDNSLRRLVRHYVNEPIDGLILAATTGEGLTLDEEETERLVSVVAEEIGAIGRSVPVFLGLSGSDTRKLVRALQLTSAWPIDGYLIACPYYTRPSQTGMVRHFSALAAATPRPIMLQVSGGLATRIGQKVERLEVTHSPYRILPGLNSSCADLSHDRPCG